VLARIRESDYREQLAQARAQQSEAAAGMTKARLDFERAERLYATQSLTRPDLEAARASFETARARLAAADAAQRAAELVLRDASLAAPMDAVVLSRTIERGTLASPGVAAFTLADVSALKAVFGVPEQIASALAPGDRIDVESASVAHAGTITAIAPAADSDSRVFRVEVTLPNTNGSLKPGTIATAIVRASGAAKVSDLLQLPLSAVVSAGDGDYGVFVLDGARDPAVARLRRVEIGPVLNDNTVAVTAGLAPDDVAIVSGAPLLVDGESVRVIP
jgi:multidrug efflux system membrane fusion protein